MKQTNKVLAKKIGCIVGGIFLVIGISLVTYTFVYPSRESGRIQITFNVTLAGSLLLCGIGIVLLFAFLAGQQKNILIFATAVAGGVAAIYSAFYAGQALKVNMQREKIWRSVQIITELDGAQITSVRHFILKAVELNTTTL